MNLLIVEDQALVRGALCALLNLEPAIQVMSQAEDGEQALAYLRNNAQDIDVVVTDIEMPNMTGIEFLILKYSLLPRLDVPGILNAHWPWVWMALF